VHAVINLQVLLYFIVFQNGGKLLNDYTVGGPLSSAQLHSIN
jgi:hypothetical protein